MKKIYHRERGMSEKKLSATQLEAIAREVERQRFLAGLNTDFAALRNNPTAWQEELAERAEWDCTLADGLTDE